MISITLGLLFVVSGFVKGVDPVGVSYKVSEYLGLFGLDFLVGWSLGLAVLLCAAEIFIGLMLLSGVYRKISSLLALLFLSGFTIITLYLVIDPSSAIQECGCFGDAFKLTNTETFLKNVFFTFLAILYFRRQWITQNILSSSGKRVIYIGLTIYIGIISLFIPLYSIIYLPPFDFLPFNRGVNVLENINKNNTTSNDNIFLIYKNKQSGENCKFRLSDTTWKDATLWEYVDTETPKIEYENYLSRFVVMNEDSEDCASTVFDYSEYNFIIIARNIDDMRVKDFEKIEPLYKLSQDETINLYLFTSSGIEDAKKQLSSQNMGNIPIYNVDEVVLKSMIRSPRGVMLVGGVISGKWNLRQNYFEGLTKEKLPALVAGERYTLLKYIIILLSSVMVIVCLRIINLKKLGKTLKKKGEKREKE